MKWLESITLLALAILGAQSAYLHHLQNQINTSLMERIRILETRNEVDGIIGDACRGLLGEHRRDIDRLDEQQKAQARFIVNVLMAQRKEEP